MTHLVLALLLLLLLFGGGFGLRAGTPLGYSGGGIAGVLALLLILWLIFGGL